ncbi:MAG TPA: hypothetical protein VKR06_08455 [Ktedonosporobacter sp.]|nr:hypothetical protein [Ktedonosporobacter sp.]
MLADHLEQFGSFDGPVMREQDVASPGSHEGVARVPATSLTRRQLMIIHRTSPPPLGSTGSKCEEWSGLMSLAHLQWKSSTGIPSRDR